MNTQWRYTVSGAQGCLCPMPIGLDYSALPAVSRALGIDVSPGIFHRMRALEYYELNRLREK